MMSTPEARRRDSSRCPAPGRIDPCPGRARTPRRLRPNARSRTKPRNGGDRTGHESGADGDNQEQAEQERDVPGVRQHLVRRDGAGATEASRPARNASAWTHAGERGARKSRSTGIANTWAWRSAKTRLQNGYSLIVSLTTRDVAQK